MSSGFLAEAFSQGCQWKDRIALEAGLLSDPDESKIPQLNPLPLAYGLALADSSERLLLAWTNEKEPKIKISQAIKEIRPPMIGLKIIHLQVLSLA